ncbi:MAG: hypothetical protein WC485_04945, partial [Opitutaceae bacterium]
VADFLAAEADFLAFTLAGMFLSKLCARERARVGSAQRGIGIPRRGDCQWRRDGIHAGILPDSAS